MKILIVSDVHFVEFNPMLDTILQQSKLKMFRAGFLKKNGSYRHGKFDLRKRSKHKNSKGNKKLDIDFFLANELVLNLLNIINQRQKHHSVLLFLQGLSLFP